MGFSLAPIQSGPRRRLFGRAPPRQRLTLMAAAAAFNHFLVNPAARRRNASKNSNGSRRLRSHCDFSLLRVSAVQATYLPASLRCRIQLHHAACTFAPVIAHSHLAGHAFLPRAAPLMPRREA
jgi:hypothetical protein